SPAARVIVAFLVSPGTMPSTSSTTVSPLKISNSCSWLPTFLIENVTAPAGTVIAEGVNAYSFASIAITPEGTAVAGPELAVLPPAHAASRHTNGSRRTAARGAWGRGT